MDLVRPNTQEEVTSMKCSQCGTEMTVELTDVLRVGSNTTF